MDSVFLSHCWRKDSLGRSTHARARQLCEALKRAGERVWFDEEQLACGNIYAGMTRGIDEMDVFIACITRAYIEKVNAGLKHLQNRDNCALEYSYAMIRHKPVIGVVMEPDLLDACRWPVGPVTMHLGGNIFIDATGDDWSAIADRVCHIIRHISPRCPRCPTPRTIAAGAAVSRAVRDATSASTRLRRTDPTPGADSWSAIDTLGAPVAAATSRTM